jgi:hypothetical protein
MRPPRAFSIAAESLLPSDSMMSRGTGSGRGSRLERSTNSGKNGCRSRRPARTHARRMRNSRGVMWPTTATWELDAVRALSGSAPRARCHPRLAGGQRRGWSPPSRLVLAIMLENFGSMTSSGRVPAHMAAAGRLNGSHSPKSKKDTMDSTYIMINKELRQPTPAQHKKIAEYQEKTGKGHRIFELKDGQLHGVSLTESDIVITKEGTVGKPGHWPGIYIERHRKWTKRSGKQCSGDVFHYINDSLSLFRCMACGRDAGSRPGKY